jgi:phage shock protein PspC (stress-responsive transcriptional regulator)
MDKSRLVRSQSDRMLGGVCGGLGQYLGIDAILVRIFFLLFAFAGGGVLVYLILWMVIPDEERVFTGSDQRDFGERAREMGQDFRTAVHKPNSNAARWIGIALVAAGVFYLLQSLHLPWLFWLKQEYLWPVLLILAGAALVYRGFRKDQQ